MDMSDVLLWLERRYSNDMSLMLYCIWALVALRRVDDVTAGE